MRLFLSVTIAAVLAAVVAAQDPRPAAAVATNIPYADARPILDAIRPDLLPADLQGTAADIEARWSAWVSRRDADIRARLAAGDGDSLINLLLFGVTFTSQPRIRARDILSLGAQGRSAEMLHGAVLQRRIDDLIAGIAAPGASERLQFAGSVLAAAGIDPGSPASSARIRQYLEDGLARVLAEYATYAQTPAAEQSVRFGARGLSSDTSISPAFALEQALDAIKAAGLLRSGAVRRVAIVGPGLDFTDKREGYDFYPPQTIQPFAIVDSLLRLDLAGEALETATFDLSPRVNEHLRAAAGRARAGGAYVLHLPRDKEAGWTAELAAYWERFGAWIGEPADAVAPPPGVGVEVRALRVRPAIVTSITPRDVNIVLQRLERPGERERFDLIVATNLLVYYDVFERSLALANIAAMLRPGGIFLANNAAPVILPPGMTSIGYSESVYSSRLNDKDRIEWYRRVPSDPPIVRSRTAR